MDLIVLPKFSTIEADYPFITFREKGRFYWSATENCVYYSRALLKTTNGLYHLFHEMGHALSQHREFRSGIGLLKLETEAWSRAQEIADRYKLKIRPALVEQCLNSYRDWLHLRSTCPSCYAIATEVSPYEYHCFNCSQKWKVPIDQRKRYYRLKLTAPT